MHALCGTAKMICAGAVFCLGTGLATAQEEPASVLVERVEARAITDTTPIIGQLTATVEASVATRTAGIVSEVRFQVGDGVSRGQLLARLDAELIEIRLRTARAALEAAEAGVAVAKARAKRAAQALERQSRLKGSTAFSKGQYEDLQQSAAEARSELARAEAEVGSAEAALERAQYDKEHAEIRAPFAGVVVTRAAQPGQYIALGESVATLLDTDRLEIEAEIPVDLVSGLDQDTEVIAGFAGGRRLEARLRSILPVETVETQTRPVRFTADLRALPSTELADGNSVILEIPVSAPREATMVPKDALVQSRDGWRVFVVEQGKAVPRPVRLGQPDGARMEVLSGLKPGEVVVVRGNERLRPGQPVEPEPSISLGDEMPDSPAVPSSSGEETDPPAQAGPASAQTAPERS